MTQEEIQKKLGRKLSATENLLYKLMHDKQNYTIVFKNNTFEYEINRRKSV